MSEPSSPEAFLPVTPAAFHILLALAHQERHGYSIMQAVSEQTHGEFRLGPGTLYRSIKQLVVQGLIEPSDERPDPEMDDERRRYYRISALGRRVASLESARLERLAKLAREQGFLSGGGDPAIDGGGL